MPIENKVKEQILEKAFQLFCQFGFSKVSMDELSSELGMSKKTLYQTYSSKNELLKDLLDHYHSSSLCELNKILDNTKIDYNEKLNHIFTCGLNAHKQTEILRNDLKKNLPEMWNYCIQLKSKAFPKTMEKLLREGIQKGKIRSDIHIPIVILVFNACLENLAINPKVEDSKYPPEKIISEIHKTIFQGILKR